MILIVVNYYLNRKPSAYKIYTEITGNKSIK